PCTCTAHYHRAQPFTTRRSSDLDHSHDTEDQRETDRDQGIDPPEEDRRDRELGENVYLRWSQGPSGIHLARSVVNSSGHTVTSGDRKSTRLNSSHGSTSYAVWCW